MTVANMKRNHAKRLRTWDVSVRRRRAQLVRAMARVQALRRTGAPKRTLTRAKANLANLEFYGVLNRHHRHWKKVRGVWGHL